MCVLCSVAIKKDWFPVFGKNSEAELNLKNRLVQMFSSCVSYVATVCFLHCILFTAWQYHKAPGFKINTIKKP